MNEIIKAAQELGMADHISFNGQLLTISYPPRDVVQLPVRDFPEQQAAIKALHEIHNRVVKTK
jgi:hypothetical protein